MNTLMQMIEACARSNSRIIAIEYARNAGHITSEHAVDEIVKETADTKKELQTIKKQFVNDRKMEAMNYE